MAQKTIYVDDIDGTEGAQPTEFELLGGSFTLDLSEANRHKLGVAIGAFEPFNQALKDAGASPAQLNATVISGDRVPDPEPQGVKAPTRPDLPDTPENIRAWARANGWEPSAKGKIARKVVDAFIAADNGAKGNRPGGPAGVTVEATREDAEAGQDGQGGEPFAPPADDAHVEDWRAYAVTVGGLAADDVYRANRSQLRTMLGIEQPMPAGPEWGDTAPAAPTPAPVAPPVTQSAPNPEAGTTDTPTLGQRLHREADARKEAVRVATEAATAAAQAVREQAESTEVALQEAELAEQVAAAESQAPLTPEQVEEQARAEIAAANGEPIPEPATILPFKTP